MVSAVACRLRCRPAGPPQRRGDDELRVRVEPADHSLGCSRGGLSSKTYVAVDGHGRAAGRADRPSQGGDTRSRSPSAGNELGTAPVQRTMTTASPLPSTFCADVQFNPAAACTDVACPTTSRVRPAPASAGTSALGRWAQPGQLIAR
jgi:hypothetical protein